MVLHRIIHISLACLNALKKFIKEYLKEEGDTICLVLLKAFAKVFDKNNGNKKVQSKCTKFSSR